MSYGKMSETKLRFLFVRIFIKSLDSPEFDMPQHLYLCFYLDNLHLYIFVTLGINILKILRARIYLKFKKSNWQNTAFWFTVGCKLCIRITYRRI